jgi:hypothetical protein
MISRRDFLKIAGVLGGVAASRLGAGWLGPLERPWPPERPSSVELQGSLLSFRGRVAAKSINIYPLPDFQRKSIGRLPRDTLLKLLDEFESPKGPAYNPRWYRIEEGFVHSGHIQRLEKVYSNAPVESLPEGGQLGEITVPLVQCLRKLRTGEWDLLYRLYYQSVYWVTSLEEGPDGIPWYGLTDDLLGIQYCVPAYTVRLIRPEELTPIAPEVPEEEKRIEVSLFDQTLTAYQGDQVVLHTLVSTGLPSGWLDPDEINDEDWIDPETPQGQYRISVKKPSRHMGDGRLTDDPNAYELPGVPWVSFFYKTGVAFHGTYWHDNFGRKMSHGCVNMRTEEAKWLYRWTMPLAGAQEKNAKGLGTRVIVT